MARRRSIPSPQQGSGRKALKGGGRACLGLRSRSRSRQHTKARAVHQTLRALSRCSPGWKGLAVRTQSTGRQGTGRGRRQDTHRLPGRPRLSGEADLSRQTLQRGQAGLSVWPLAGPSSRPLSWPRPGPLALPRAPGAGGCSLGDIWLCSVQATVRGGAVCHTSEAARPGLIQSAVRATFTLFPGGAGGPRPVGNDCPSPCPSPSASGRPCPAAPEVGEACPGPPLPQSNSRTPERRQNGRPPTNMPPSCV